MRRRNSWVGRRRGGGKAGEFGGVEAEGEPFGEDFGAEGFVEVEGGGVPLERAPFETGATGGAGLVGGGDEELATETAFAERRADVEIFEKRAGASEEGGERGIPDGETGGGAGMVGDERAHRGAGAEEVKREQFGGDLALVLQALEGGEFADEGEQGGHVGDGGGTEVEAGVSAAESAAGAGGGGGGMVMLTAIGGILAHGRAVEKEND